MSERPEQQILALTGRLAETETCWISTDDTDFVESFAGPMSAGESVWIHGAKGVGKTALVTRLVSRNHWAYYDCAEISSDNVFYFFDAISEIDTLILDHVRAYHCMHSYFLQRVCERFS